MKLVVIFLISFAICCANAAERPRWYQAVNIKFQKATPFYNHYTNADLAHVVSWADIEAIVNAWSATRKGPKNKRLDLTKFVRYLTEVDTQACVYDPSLNLPGCTLHTVILNHNGGALKNLNTNIRNEVLAEIAKPFPSTSKIKKLLNSAPANLRYGTGRNNRQIQGWVDPMGNINKQLTPKEKSMIYATDANGINYRLRNLINNPFRAYYDFFNGANLNIHPRGSHYDPDPTIRTAANQQFVPIAANNNKLYVLSSSQAGACPLGALQGDQNNQVDTIKYYVQNV